MADTKQYLDYAGMTRYDAKIKSHLADNVSAINASVKSLQASLGLPSEYAPDNAATGVYKYVDDAFDAASGDISALKVKIGLDENFANALLGANSVIDYVTAGDIANASLSNAINASLNAHAAANASATAAINASITGLRSLVEVMDSSHNASLLNISSHIASLETRLGWPSTSAGAANYGIYKELEDREAVIAATFSKLNQVIGLDSSMENPRIATYGSVIGYIDAFTGLSAASPAALSGDCAYGDMESRLSSMEAKLDALVAEGADGFYLKNKSGQIVMALKDDGVHVRNIIIDDDNFDANL